MSLRLRILGAPRAFRAGAELADLPAQRLRFALLVYLAMERESSREALLTLFWPDRAPIRGRHSLRQMLYELRQLLGEDWIEVRRDRVMTRVDVDASSFEALAAAGDRVGALSLYEGPFLDGFVLDNHAFDGWVDRQRARLNRLHRRLRREHIASLGAADDVEAALEVARRWVALDPLEDEAAHALLACMGAAGQRTAALQYFDAYARQLQTELQVEPLDETRALVERIRSGETVTLKSALHDAEAGNGPVPPAQAPVSGKAPAPPPAGGSGHGGFVVPASRFASEGDAVATAVAARPGRLYADGGAAEVSADRAPASATGRQAKTRDGGPRSHTAPSLPTWAWLGVAAALLVVVAVTVLLRQPDPALPLNGPPGARIAILPFSDHSGGGAQASLAGALTDVLAQSLARSRALDVISPNGVALLRERGTPSDSVGRILSADFLVGGSITAAGDRVRVAIELLDGRTGFVVRHDVVERPIAESRMLVEDVVTRTAAFLRREVGDQVEVKRVRAQTSSEEAWRDVLAAKAVQGALAQLIRERQYDAVLHELSRADSMLARAATLDRRWAEPLLLRGWLLERRAFVLRLSAPADTASARKLLEAGRSMADRAAERNPKDPRVPELRGTLLNQLAMLPGVPGHVVIDRLASAEQELRRATELDALNQGAWRRLADVLQLMGRNAEAKVAAERAYRLDPLVAEVNALLLVLFATSFELNHDEDARNWCLQGRREFPDELPFLYCLLVLHGWADGVDPDPAAMRRELRRLEATHFKVQPQLLIRFETVLASVHARAGQRDSARAILARVDATHDPAVLWMAAAARIMLGEYPEAVTLLRGYASQGPWSAWRIIRSRPFRPLESRPDYMRLLEEIPAPGPY
jgi:DNA-binding SARP family transcriptional activator/TolB-like protein/tetratricopeptide (TPR) repeat protein